MGLLLFLLLSCLIIAKFSIKFSDKTLHQQPENRTSPLHIINGHERLRIEPWGHNSIRIRASLYQDVTGNELGALLETPLNECGTECLKSPLKISYHNNSAVRNGLIEITVSKNKMRFWRRNGVGRELLFEELWPQHGKMARDWSFDTSGVTSRPSATFSFTLDKDEQMFGLGQHQTGKLNKKPGTYNFRHYQSETTIPFLISSKTYGFLWNVPSMGHVTLNDNNIQWATESAMVVDYVVSVAKKGDFRTLVETHSSITGRAPSFPKYGRGYIQSKTRYKNQNEVLRIAEGFQKHKIPVSMIQIDAPHWRAFGDFAFDRLKFPDPALLVKMVRKLTNGARIIANLWPLIEPSSENWLDYLSSGLVAGSTQGTGVVEFFNGTAMHLLDYTNPMTRNKTWSKIVDNYYKFGIRDFLLDCTEGGGVGEGFSFKTKTMYSLQVVPYTRPNFVYSVGTQSEVGAIFPFYGQKMIHDGLATLGVPPGDNEEGKGISFSRSAWLGSQRFSNVLWSGDIDGSWESFRAQITAGLNVQLAGITWWASDIGGYYAKTGYHGNISDPQYQELYVRWFQYGTFNPVMRAHGRRKCLPKDQDGFDSCPNEPWSFGKVVFPHITRFIHLRYTMDLYIKALFKEASRSGTPLQRPLFFDFATVDPYTIMYAEELKNQFMFGPNLLIAVITIPGASKWRVYLPVDTVQKEQNNGSANTTLWRDWWSDEIHYGGNFVTLNISIARIPVFYRGTRQDLLAGRIIG